MRVQSLSWEDALEKSMATHSSILAWRIPWIEEPGGLQSIGAQRVRHNWMRSMHAFMPSHSLSHQFFTLTVKWSEVAQSCPTLCDPMDYSPPHSSIHGIFQARVLEWGAIALNTSYRHVSLHICLPKVHFPSACWQPHSSGILLIFNRKSDNL